MLYNLYGDVAKSFRQIGLGENQNSQIAPAHGRCSKSGGLNTMWQGKTHPYESGATRLRTCLEFMLP
jgi:hypothetical protein